MTRLCTNRFVILSSINTHAHIYVHMHTYLLVCLFLFVLSCLALYGLWLRGFLPSETSLDTEQAPFHHNADVWCGELATFLQTMKEGVRDRKMDTGENQSNRCMVMCWSGEAEVR